ncbi:hypothetical protein [Agrobacterium salinitolerans]|uniref:hypothetical protein n=1 Tax=Agrobacterium salinitolerans TaxID=1183413 RepID=UPI001FD9DD7E|nr:hypothetical protein [Agrobacterium salinitolerans]
MIDQAMIHPKDELPRIFQANLFRFYERVVAPAFDNLLEPPPLEFGDVDTIDVYLDRTAAQVDAHTRNEAAKAFVLTTAGLFERQLRHWARHLFGHARLPDVRTQGFEALLMECLQEAGVDGSSDDVAPDLIEAFLVANVVRHGDGRASTKLRAAAPRLWTYDRTEYVDINAGHSPDSEQIRIRSDDVKRYFRAGLRFWGRVDPLPMAATESPI